MLDGQQGSYYYAASNPSADPTLTLTGDVTGSATFTNLGNATLTAVVANNSHQHTQLYANSTITYGASQLQWTDLSGAGGTGANGSTPKNPTSDWYHHIITNHANNGGYYYDLSLPFHQDELFFRRVSNGTQGAFRKVWHDGNDGSGSGLDADLLDGLHASSFLRSDGNDETTGALTISGSATSGGVSTVSQYHTGADNLILKGNSSGISSIFFQSEKDGTNINHTSDFGFLQFHSYGTNTVGEANELILGVSNDSDDCVIVNAPSATGFKFRTGASATDYTVFHEGNSTAFTSADNAKLVGIEAGAKADQVGLVKGADIGGSVDLNTYTTDGYFHQNGNTNATSGTNYPVALAGMLSVQADGGMVYQKYQTYNGDGTWQRTKYGTTWFAWDKILDTGNSEAFTSADQLKLNGIATGATNTVTNATHTGEVTGSGALTVADNVIDAGNLESHWQRYNCSAVLTLRWGWHFYLGYSNRHQH